MNISSGRGLNGSSAITQRSPRISSRLLVSKRPSASTTTQVPSLNETSRQSSSPVAVFQIRRVESKLPVNTNLPSPENATLRTGDGCLNSLTSFPLSASHNLTNGSLVSYCVGEIPVSM